MSNMSSELQLASVFKKKKEQKKAAHACQSSSWNDSVFIFYASRIVRLFALRHGNRPCINNLTSRLVYLHYTQCFALRGRLPYSARHLFQSHHPKTSYLKGKERTCPQGMFNFCKVLSDGESWRAASFSTVQRKFVMALLRDWSQLCTSCKHQNMWQCQDSSSHKYTRALLN